MPRRWDGTHVAVRLIKVINEKEQCSWLAGSGHVPYIHRNRYKKTLRNAASPCLPSVHFPRTFSPPGENVACFYYTAILVETYDLASDLL